MNDAFELYRTWQLVVNLLLVAMFLGLHWRTRRIQALMKSHLESGHEHLQATADLMIRVSELDGKPVRSADT